MKYIFITKKHGHPFIGKVVLIFLKLKLSYYGQQYASKI